MPPGTAQPLGSAWSARRFARRRCPIRIGLNRCGILRRCFVPVGSISSQTLYSKKRPSAAQSPQSVLLSVALLATFDSCDRQWYTRPRCVNGARLARTDIAQPATTAEASKQFDKRLLLCYTPARSSFVVSRPRPKTQQLGGGQREPSTTLDIIARRVGLLRLVFSRLATAPAPSQLNRDDETHSIASELWMARELRLGSIPHNEEFDPGSGRTLAACLMHASRTHCLRAVSGARLRNTWESARPWGITRRKAC